MRHFECVITHPSQAFLADFIGQTELDINDELHAWYNSEEGTQYDVEKTRSFSIEQQAYYSGHFQEWFVEEFWDQRY